MRSIKLGLVLCRAFFKLPLSRTHRINTISTTQNSQQHPSVIQPNQPKSSAVRQSTTTSITTASPIPTNTPPQQTSTVGPTDLIIPPSAPKSIALITCSTRPGRINPSITAYILSLLAPHLPPTLALTLTTIDLATLSLPLLNEPTIPAALDKLNPNPHYLTPHARTWSSEIRKHRAFIFVTPQYNWSMPASIKNALDYLYWEWSGKPAIVVSYGGHGGGRSKEALEMVLRGLKMRVINGVEVTVKVPEVFVLGEVLDDGVKVVGEEMRAVWKEQGVQSGVERAWGDVVRMLGE